MEVNGVTGQDLLRDALSHYYAAVTGRKGRIRVPRSSNQRMQIALALTDTFNKAFPTQVDDGEGNSVVNPNTDGKTLAELADSLCPDPEAREGGLSGAAKEKHEAKVAKEQAEAGASG